MKKFLTLANAARAAILAAAALLPLVHASHRTQVYLAAELLADALLLSLLLLRPRGGGDRAFVVAVSALLAADTLYALKYLWAGFPDFLFSVQVTIYLIYNVSASWYMFRAYLSDGPREKAETVLLLSLFAVFTALQIKYVAIPAATGSYASDFIALAVPAHRVVESMLLALAVLLGMKARSGYWLLTLNGLTLLPLSSFAIGYSTTAANGVTYAEYGWVLGLFSLLAAQTCAPAAGQRFARWNSIRVRLVWFVCAVAAAMLLLLYLLQAFVAKDVFSLTSYLFFLLFGVWFFANLIAFRVSEAIHRLLETLEPGGAPAAAPVSGLVMHETDLFAAKLRSAYATIREQAGLAALASLSAQVAHDIRSPLAALDSALKDVSQLPEEKRLLIRGAACRIRDIADDLLDKNRAAPAAGPCLLSGLIEEIAAEKRLQFRERAGVAVAVKTDPAAAGLRALARRAELGRALSNLVNNGVEALERGGTVTIGLARDGEFAALTVTDDGKGIPPEILAGLGARGQTVGKAGGCGLGLYQARTAAESCGGSLAITSEPGKGTSVTLRLPLAAAETAPAPGARTAALLDDDALVRLNWTLAAKAAGVELKACASAGELLAAAGPLPKDTPLYIDSDLGGGAAGEDAAKELRSLGFTDITMATGYGPEKFRHLPWLKVSGKEPPWRRQA